MAKGTAIRKISGGKLIRVDVDYSDKFIDHVKITGDFFLHPEDTLEKIEAIFPGANAEKEKELLIKNINKILSDNDASLIGVSAEDIVDVVGEAINGKI